MWAGHTYLLNNIIQGRIFLSLNFSIIPKRLISESTKKKKATQPIMRHLLLLLSS